ncbi:hypothetical protein F5B22DRAFT_637228 [Xylaria bambusicola]|uniref:uncharacterized protein n=1 Tax=Xylaria bambusicola TaxID=326684 RepID=UPI0020081A3F|nr:uncharacterized protein F5B22DRAFT_637228 [Xylaria bambusicola]KAI0513284.1 hypothetical protein F5B22DRAFT_637228 [Xylaria bambusicola]
MGSIPQPDFKLSDVEVSDAQDIGRYVEVPAMQNGPLYRTMFPQFNTATEAQMEEITRYESRKREKAPKSSWLPDTLNRIGEETDRNGRCAYVLAAPEGFPLYSKFSLKVVGHVETNYGIITSMFRPSRRAC